MSVRVQTTIDRCKAPRKKKTQSSARLARCAVARSKWLGAIERTANGRTPIGTRGATTSSAGQRCTRARAAHSVAIKGRGSAGTDTTLSEA